MYEGLPFWETATPIDEMSLEKVTLDESWFNKTEYDETRTLYKRDPVIDLGIPLSV